MGLKKYKWGQGKNTRLWTSMAVAAVTAVGCWQLYQKLAVMNIDNKNVLLWVSTVVPIGILAVVGLVLFWLVNKPNVADFLISAEGELKKVSFSSKQEIAVSTTIVIAVVIMMAAIPYLKPSTQSVFIIQER